ncbi:pX [Frog adenovirus 1]|uniref:PX n=1 Tax=Frog adenovirus 1 (strain ATCC VR-896) TaxID=114102 RepID=Q9IIH7_ADEF1|nr:pX [Frog adenovirus 1]AAF86930.1 pX [Frog adenovirus 1]
MFENLAPRKGITQIRPKISYNKELRGGFLPLLVPIIAAAISAAPGIAGAVLAAKNHN